MSKILIFILLLAGLVVGIYLIGQRTGFLSKADISTAPQNVKISNISDNSFTVSWTTVKPVNGFVQYGENESLGNTAGDDRDAKPRLTHHVTLKKLTPGTTYFYKINTGSIAKETTAPTTNDTPPLPDIVFGKVIRADKSPETEAIIYSNIADGSLLSSFTRDDGNFLITLNNARTKDLANYMTISGTDTIDLLVQTAGGSTTKQISVGTRTSPVSLTVEAEPLIENTAASVRADLNNDGVVNVFDYVLKIKQSLGR